MPLAPPPAPSPYRATWAALLSRVYDVDALKCPRCPSGRLRIIAAITEKRTILKILTHLGIDDEPPPPRRTRDPPELPWPDT